MKESNHLESAKAYLLEMLNKKRRDMSRQERVRVIQLKLYLKAKQERDYRFYVLYDKVFLPFILEESWIRVRRNGGSAGVDDVSFEKIESEGVLDFLALLREDLRTQNYRPSAVKRVEIPKTDGSTRPLGIPTIRDRVAQMACKLIIEPIFEADFKDVSYGFRPKRSASGAIKKIKETLKEGKQEVYDADLSKYFDTIPHDKLLKAVQERVSDPRIIKLIRKWLKSPISDKGQMKGGKKVKVGTPQGGVISPLLSNIYLNLLDRIITNPKSYFAKRGVEIIRYADDFVLLGKTVDQSMIAVLESILARMGLTLNQTKSQRINVRESSFDFLGFQFRYNWSIHYPETKYLNISPSPKSRKKVRDNLKQRLAHIGHFPPAAVVRSLNPILAGWINYFHIPQVSYMWKARRELQYYLSDRLLRFYQRKSQRRSRLYRQSAYQRLTNHHNLINPMTYRYRPTVNASSE